MGESNKILKNRRCEVEEIGWRGTQTLESNSDEKIIHSLTHAHDFLSVQKHQLLLFLNLFDAHMKLGLATTSFP